MQDALTNLDAIKHLLRDYGHHVADPTIAPRQKAEFQRRIARLQVMKRDTEARIAALRQVRAA